MLNGIQYEKSHEVKDRLGIKRHKIKLEKQLRASVAFQEVHMEVAPYRQNVAVGHAWRP